MIDKGFAQRFAQGWIEAWNSHDLDRILSHYTDDFEFYSPLIGAVTGDVSGRVRGEGAGMSVLEPGLESGAGFAVRTARGTQRHQQ